MMVAILNNPVENLALGDDDNEYKRLLMQQLQQPVEPVQQGPSSNQLIASLSSAANQLGTVGGRTAQNPEVQRYAELIDKNKALADQQRMAQVEKKRSLLSELAKLRSNENLKNKELAYRESKDLADQKFEENILNKKLAAQAEETDKKIAADRESTEKRMSAAQQVAQNKTTRPTESQANSAYHAARMVATNQILDDIVKKSNYNPASIGAAARSVNYPLIGRYYATPEDRAYLQAAREFIASILRKESGAAVTDEEFNRYYGTYFPEVGDDDNTMKQKTASRERATKTMIHNAAGAYDPSLSQNSYTYRPDPKEGDAYATPVEPTSEKALEEMSDEELDAELSRLGGK